MEPHCHLLFAVKAAAAVTARKLVHQYPVFCSAYVGLGVTLYGTWMRECTEPSTQQQRCLILQVPDYYIQERHLPRLIFRPCTPNCSAAVSR